MKLRRWSAAIEGLESGTVYALGFMRFRRRVTAQRWVDRMNGRSADTLTRYVVVRR
jgi:hypothetical protein